MTKKRRTGLAIGLTAACIAVLCAAGACNRISKEEKAVRPVVTTSATEVTTTTVPVTTTVPQTTTTATCVTAGTTTEPTTTADTTVPATTIQVLPTAS